MFEKKPFISKLASLVVAASVVSVGQAQVKPTPASSVPTKAPAVAATDAEKQQASNTLSKHRQAFIENRGQWDSRARFMIRRPGMDVWITNAGWRVDAFKTNSKEKVGHVFQLNFLGSQEPKFKGVDPDNMVWDYMGRDASEGEHHYATGYRQVKAPGLYPGVDAVYRVDGGAPRFDLHVKPHVDPSAIKLGVKGSDGIVVGAKGDLEAKTSVGTVSFGGLKAYQVIAGREVPVKASFKIEKSGAVAFNLGKYDHSKELVIDPIIYGTYFGGDQGWDEVHACATDTSQGTYITGSTQENGFPANFGPYRLTISGIQDAFVAKLQGDVYNRDYAAIFGGSGSDQGDYIQVDRQGNVWVAGLSDSYNFPGSGNDQHLYVKQDVTATGGTVTFTVGNLSTGAGFSFTLPYNFTAAQLQAKINTVYPTVKVTLNEANFDVFVPYPTKLAIQINSFDTWARLTNKNVPGNAYFVQAGKPTAASGGTFALSGFNGNPSKAFTTAPIPYNCTPAVLSGALSAATGGATWIAGFDPLLAAGTTPAFPANGIILVAPTGAAITGIDQSLLTGGSLYLGQFAVTAINTDKAHSAPTGGAIEVNGAGPQIPWPTSTNGAGTSITTTALQTALTTALAAYNWRYAIVVPPNSSTPAGGDLLVYAAIEGTTTNAPLGPPPLTFTPTGNFGPFTLTPTPNYYSSSRTSTYYRFGFLMRWKADPNTVLSPEVGKEKVLTWSCKDANVTINGFRIFKTSDTPSNEKVPFLIAGTNFNPDQLGDPTATSPVDYAYINPTGRVGGTIGGFVQGASFSYRLRATFDPTTNVFTVLNSPTGVAASGYDGDSAAARVVTRGSTVDSFGNQVIAGTVYYGSNFDTRLPGTPFKTTANVYNSAGFDGRLLRRNDIFVRKYDVNGVLTSSCLIGGNSNDEAGGYNIPKEMVVFPNPLSSAFSWPSGGGISFQETITGSAVAVDGQNNVYVTGISRSFDFPRTRGVFGETFDQFNRVTVTKLAPDLSALVYSTHLNANNVVYPGGIAVGPGGAAYVTGNIHPWTVDFPHPGSTDTWGNAPQGIGDSNIPTTADALRPQYLKTSTPDIPAGDGWLMVLNSTATGLIYSSYIGSELDDVVYQPFVDRFGDCWISGWSATRRDILLWPSHTATSGTRYLVDSNLGTVYGGGQSQITPLAFKTNTDLSTQYEYNIAYGILDTRLGPQQPLVFPPTDAPYPGYYSEARDGLLQRYRFNLPVLQGISYDQPTLAGGLGNNATGTVTISQPAPAPGMTLTLKMTNNTAASFNGQAPLFQTVVTIPTGATSATFTVYTNTVASLTPVDISASFQGDIKFGRLVVAPWFSSLALTPSSVVGGQAVQGNVVLFQNAPVGGVPVSITSANNSLVTVPATVTVPAGQAQAVFNITTAGVTSATVVQVSASFAGYGGNQQLTLTPANLFTLTFDPTIVDAKSTATGTIKLDGIPGAKFNVTPVPGSLPAGFSVSPNPIFFDPTDTTQDPTTRTFTLTTPFLAQDANINVTFRRSDNPSQTITAPIQVLADPVTGVSVGTNQLAGGQSTVVSVSITQPAAKGGAIVHIKSSSPAVQIVANTTGSDVYGLIPEGASTANFNVNTVVVLSDTSVTISADRGSPATGVPGGIVKTSAPFIVNGIGVALAVSPNSVAGGTSATGTITLSTAAPSPGVNIGITSSNPAIAKVPSSVKVPTGSKTATFVIGTVQPANGVTAQATITAALGNKMSTDTLTVRAPSPLSVSFNPASVTSGNASVGTVTLDSAAASGGAKVILTNSDPTIITIPTSVLVQAGSKVATFPVATKAISVQKTATVTATFNGVSVQGTVTVVPATVASVSFSPSSVTGGTSSQCTVTLNTPAPVGGAKVILTNSNPQIATVPGSIQIAAGKTFYTFTVTTAQVSRTLATTVTAKYNSSQSAAILSVTP